MPLSSLRLVLHSLLYHGRLNFAVALGVMAGTAVLTGALVVGDSVRWSLRHLTLDRLGTIDESLVADRFFRADLAGELAANPEFKESFGGAFPLILLTGTVELAQTKARAGNVSLVGCDERFWKLGRGGPDVPPGPLEIVLNLPLAEELQARAGDEVLVRFERRSDIPSESSLGRKTDLTVSRRLTVREIIPAQGLGRFGLSPDQQIPRNAYLPLSTLQGALDQRGNVNAIVVAGKQDTGTAGAEPGPGSASLEGTGGSSLERLLKPKLADYGLSIEEFTVPKTGGRYFQLSSDRMLLHQHVEEVAASAFADLSPQPVLVYLANSISAAAGKERREVPYSTMAALDLAAEPPLGPFLTPDGQPIGPLAADEIVLNDWAAKDLGVRTGAEISVAYFEPESTHGQVAERTKRFRLKAICALAGPAADRHLTPELKGVTDQASMDAWDPPFPYDGRRVRDQDEQYWRDYRATPKAFVSLSAGRKLWASRFGRTTSVRIPARNGLTAQGLSQRLKLDPARLGFRFRPVKQEGLAAAEGTTPFNLLFLGFSMFIIAAAVMLVALLFRLGVDRRAREIGVLLATGFRNRSVRRLLAAEGLLVAAAGGLAGAAVGIGYAWLMLYGLRTWWRAAVSTPSLQLDWTWRSLAIGCASGVLVSLAAIAWALWQMRHVAVRRLLSGQASEGSALVPLRRRWPTAAVAAALLAAVGLGLVALRLGGEAQAGAFFGSGGLVLVALLVWVWHRLHGAAGGSLVAAGRGALSRLAARNGARNPGRSTLAIGLVASAAFLIVATSAFRQDLSRKQPQLASGDGGFALVAESDAIYHDLNTPEGRQKLRILGDDAQALSGSHVYSLRVKPGDDASCLNLYQTLRPRILGVPPPFVRRGGFAWGKTAAGTAAERANPWRLLESRLAPVDGSTVVPVVADENTATYSLHLGVGDRLRVDAGQGREIELQIVGLLKNSIFQGVLLMSERDFLKQFPDSGGFRFFLIETPPADVQRVSQALESSLGDFGFDTQRTSERLAGFLAVQNTYLLTFQSLGGLGLLLGTFGLGAVQLRNVLERRGELALLRAAGFRRAPLARLVMLENIFLLLGGLGVGVLAALVAVWPHLASGGAAIPWKPLAGTLAAVLTVGLAAGAAAVRAALNSPLLPALRAE